MESACTTRAMCMGGIRARETKGSKSRAWPFGSKGLAPYQPRTSAVLRAVPYSQPAGSLLQSAPRAARRL